MKFRRSLVILFVATAFLFGWGAAGPAKAGHCWHPEVGGDCLRPLCEIVPAIPCGIGGGGPP